MRRTRGWIFFVVVLLVALDGWGKDKRFCVSPASAAKFLNTSSRLQLQSHPKTPAQTTSSEGVVVVAADPELLIVSNSFDLRGMAIHFQPALRGRYTYHVDNAGFDGSASDTVTLKDDDSRELIFQHFAFPYGKKTYDRCYVNSNGNVTFEQPDAEPPSAENLSKSIPRIAGFFADLDPESVGAVLVNQNSERVIISWLKVPEFFNHDTFDYGQNTFQIVLSKDGRIDLVYASEMSATQAFVGIFSGIDRAPLRFTDFSQKPVLDRPFLSHVENFHDYTSIDLKALMKVLYQTQPDRYDFVTLFSNFDLTPVPGAQAFAINVQNDVRGIGNPSQGDKPIFKDNEEFGSSRRLQNITFFGNIHKYPSDYSERIPEANASLLEILAHEMGHRWLSYVLFSKDGADTDQLLGREKSHWSFFFNTSGSFLEGNAIQQRSSSSFVTGKPFQTFSDLDLYLMGFLSAEEVSNSYYVDEPDDFVPDFAFRSSSAPEEGIKFHGTMIPVRVEDIIAANGSRKPSAESAQRNFRHLFVLIVKNDSPATPEEISALNLLRTEWEGFFHTITRERATIDTTN